jgi:hypothetical protein
MRGSSCHKGSRRGDGASYVLGDQLNANIRRAGGDRYYGKGQLAPDPNAFFKSLCDTLVHAGALVDDNRQHVELAPVTFSRDLQT